MANEDQNGLDKKVADLSVTDAGDATAAAAEASKPAASVADGSSEKELEPAEKSLLQKVIRKGRHSLTHHHC